ncbi:MAG: chorismate synthase [Methanomicrobiaceae archaeon]|nr:chorismate synthase [Methanomicrobiaceae archaeon]
MNTFGMNFRCTSFGESHGPALGVVVDGCPPGIPFSTDDVQPLLDRRRPGARPLTSVRQEPDRVEILSGTFQGRTTGMPVAMIVQNTDVRSEDYEPLKDVFRPGHADITFHQKYGIRDWRGGGRSSGRETVARVMAGALAMKFLSRWSIEISGSILSIHGKHTPGRMEAEIRAAMEAGNSVGGVVQVIARGVPAGLGDPVFGKLDTLIAGAMMGIGAVKGVEIGEGFGAALLLGSENNDQMDRGGSLSNHAGGILGGISNGNDIVVRIAVKPTASIRVPQKTVDREGEERTITVSGRHDPCIVPRIVPVAECMLALVLADCALEQLKYRSIESA